MTIERFRGAYLPFSNMYSLPVPIRADCGVWVPSSEHAYMANRFSSLKVQKEVAAARGEPESQHPCKDAMAARQLAYQHMEKGEKLEIVTDDERVELMRRVVYQKIERNVGVRALLLATDEEMIYEGNDWGDQFWGVSPLGSREGKNHLGQILMQLRSDFAYYGVQ